jgi:hypothetical protein
MDRRKLLRAVRRMGLTPTLVHGARTTRPSSTLASTSAAIRYKYQKLEPPYESKKESGMCRTAPMLIPSSSWEDSQSWNFPRSMRHSIGQHAALLPRTARWKSARSRPIFLDLGGERRLVCPVGQQPTNSYGTVLRQSSPSIPWLTRKTCPSGCLTCISRVPHGMSAGLKVISSPAPTHCL